MTVAAVIFDLDGTLLDTLADIGGSMNEVLAGHGLVTHDIDEYRTFVGDGIERLVGRSLAAAGRGENGSVALIEDFRRVYAARATMSTVAYAGIPELLDELSYRGLPLSVLSNKPDPLTRQIVGKCLGSDRFADVRGARLEAARKPDPAAAIEQAVLMGAAPADTLLVGDSGTDMATALAAGMTGVGVLWGFREASELTREGAARLIDRPSELLEMVDAI